MLLALTGFEPALRFVDHVNAAFATHNAAVTVPVLERAERIANFHVHLLSVMARTSAGLRAARQPLKGGQTSEIRWWAILGSNQ